MGRTILATVALVAAMLVAPPADASPPALAGAPRAVVSIDWSMPDRFGLDEDGDGLVDLPNTTEYVHGRAPGSCPSGCRRAVFPVRVDALGVVTAPTTAGSRVRLPVASYEWRVRGGGYDLRRWTSGPGLDLLLPEGRFDVDLTLRARVPFGTISVRGGGPVVVDDLLVVALGDSYASGDGNPEVADSGRGAQWAEGGIDPTSDGDHAAARRSTVAWPARVAMALERDDPRTSVTFVSLATSGATIDRGVVGARSGRPAQIDRLPALVGDRDVDVALVSVGGNDIGFSEVVRSLVDADPLLDPICYDLDVQQTLDAARDGDWTRSTTARYDPPFGLRCVETRRDGKALAGLAGLPAAFDRMATSLRPFDIGRVLLTGYPDPSGGGACGEIVGDAVPWPRLHEIDRPEAREGIARILDPLNAAVAAAAGRHGWTFVPGIAEAFADGHGYCAAWPDYGYPEDFHSRPSFLRSRAEWPEGWYRNPGIEEALVEGGDGVSWYRTAAQSGVLQGPNALYTAGTMHPNELGHAAIAGLVLGVLGAGD